MDAALLWISSFLKVAACLNASATGSIWSSAQPSSSSGVGLYNGLSKRKPTSNHIPLDCLGPAASTTPRSSITFDVPIATVVTLAIRSTMCCGFPTSSHQSLTIPEALADLTCHRAMIHPRAERERACSRQPQPGCRRSSPSGCRRWWPGHRPAFPSPRPERGHTSPWISDTPLDLVQKRTS